jgi:Zn-dependent protease
MHSLQAEGDRALSDVEYALFLLLALACGLYLRELIKARIADRAGDPTPRLHGRLGPDPRRWIDPFGTLVLPALILALVASGSAFLLPPFAYAKPLPLEPGYHRRGARDTMRIHLAGPITNLALAGVVAVPLRLGASGHAGLLAFAFLDANLALCLVNLLPVPGLDGSKLFALLLPARPREVYANLDPYLPLFVMLIFFFLGRWIFAIENGLAGGICRVLAGPGICP